MGEMFLVVDKSLPNGIEQNYVKDMLSHFNKENMVVMN